MFGFEEISNNCLRIYTARSLTNDCKLIEMPIEEFKKSINDIKTLS